MQPSVGLHDQVLIRLNLASLATNVYIRAMSTKIDPLSDVMPSAIPNEAEIAAWEALPRDEQLRRMQDALNHPNCNTVSKQNLDEILALARQRVSDRKNG